MGPPYLVRLGPPYFMGPRGERMAGRLEGRITGLGRGGVGSGAGPPYFTTTGLGGSMSTGGGRISIWFGPPYLVARGPPPSIPMGDGPPYFAVMGGGLSAALEPFFPLHAARKADTAEVLVSANHPPAAPVNSSPRKDRRLRR